MEINWRNIGEAAYEHYSRTMKGRDIDGNPLPPFDQLPPRALLSWINAVRTACDLFGRAVTA